MDYLSSISDDHYAYGYTSIDDYNGFRKGRPSGGTAVFWEKNLPATQITSHSGLIIGLKLDNDASQILVLNVYLPYCCPENFDAYQTYLGELSSFCNINAALEIFILGDFKAGKSNQFCQILMNFCEDNNFIISDDSLLPDTGTSFAYISDSRNSTSWIDHCVTSATAHRLIINIEVLLECICSDHHPLLVNISYSPTVNHHSNNIRDQKSSDYKPINWQNLTPREKVDYYQSTKSYLSNLLLPLEVTNCKNAGCNDSAHLESISAYYQGIINSLQASLHLQVHNSRRNSRIPNWSAVLKNYHEKAKTSYLTWTNSSKPKTGPVFELMRKHKKEFKKLFRQHKKKLRKQTAETLEYSFIDNHPTNQFWKNIIIQSSTKTNVLPATINGVSGTQNIINMWENYYQRLLNSTNSSKSFDLSTTHLISETMRPLNKTDKFDEVKKFLCTVDSARSLSQKLKPDCAKGLDGLSANYIMFAHEIIYLHISIFFNLCLVHSYLPAACTNSVITPIMKNKHGNVSAISNYRPIALPM